MLTQVRTDVLVVGNCSLVIFPVIEEANWLTLPEDIPKPGGGFDAVICLGNSFAHLPDFKGSWEGWAHLFHLQPFVLVDLCHLFN